MTDSRALYIICMENNIVKMRQALAGGINPNQRLNENGIKALHIVARRGHQEMVSLLLQQPDIELNPKTQYCGETPLHVAAAFGHQEVVVLLLQSLPSLGNLFRIKMLLSNVFESCRKKSRMGRYEEMIPDPLLLASCPHLFQKGTLLHLSSPRCQEHQVVPSNLVEWGELLLRQLGSD